MVDRRSCINCVHSEDTIDYIDGHKICDGINCNILGEWIDWFDTPEDCEFFDGDE